MATTPFTLSVGLGLPGDDGLPPDSISKNAALFFDSKEDAVLSLTGSGTHVFDMGTIPSVGAKGFLIALDPGSAVQPILVKFNGSSTGGIELASGGFLACANPAPAVGITAISITYASACKIRVWVLG